jgi:hypothetical protein
MNRIGTSAVFCHGDVTCRFLSRLTLSRRERFGIDRIMYRLVVCGLLQLDLGCNNIMRMDEMGAR